MVARVYGRFAPRSDEPDRWEKIAAEQDAARERALEEQAKRRQKVGEMGTVVGTSLHADSHENAVSRSLPNSRGGTRTHDPGIMSAVL